jgi:AraC-like DNA-binding protein
MACSPAQYKRIARFRNALQSGIKEGELKSLTRISYDNNYFDQSYFIKEFKRLTNLNPKKFFRQVSVLDDDKIIWEIK